MQRGNGFIVPAGTVVGGSQARVKSSSRRISGNGALGQVDDLLGIGGRQRRQGARERGVKGAESILGLAETLQDLSTRLPVIVPVPGSKQQAGVHPPETD